jgi:hypothetical protein
MNAQQFGWVLATGLLSAVFIWLSIMVSIRAVRWAKRGTKGGAVLVALAFPNPDQPPPQQIVEDEGRLKKDSESGSPPQ